MFELMINVLKGVDAVLRFITADVWFVTIEGEKVKEVH